MAFCCAVVKENITDLDKLDHQAEVAPLTPSLISLPPETKDLRSPDGAGPNQGGIMTSAVPGATSAALNEPAIRRFLGHAHMLA